jgi:DNA-binding GntR family transcriptional regulator
MPGKYPFDILHDLEGRVGRAAREHARLIDAVISRNEEAAANATREHIYAGWKELAAAITTKPATAPTANHRALSNAA